MTDISKDNPDLFVVGYESIAREIEMEWWKEQKRKIDKLSGDIDFDITEHLPSSYQRILMSSPEVFDEENPQLSSFLLKVYDSGKTYKVVASNKVVKSTKKITKKEKQECFDILEGLAQEPSGSALPRPQNVFRVGSDPSYYRKLQTFMGLPKKPQGAKIKDKVLYQYKCGRSKRKRLVWYYERAEKLVVLCFYGTRNRLEAIW